MSNPKSLQVLIAEDDYLVGARIKQMVETIRHTVVGQAINGREAVEMTIAIQPDVVLMDIDMPELDGLEATQLIQEQCPTPVIVLTAYQTPELIERASGAGVGAYLLKPPMASEMERAFAIAMARFRDLMKLRRLNAELQAEILARKQSEEALRKSQALLRATGRIAHVGGWEFDVETREQDWIEEVYRSFMKHLPAAAFIENRDGHLVYANEHFAKIAGRELQDLIGRESHEFIPPDLVGEFQKENRSVLSEGRTLEIEHTFPGPLGPTHWLTYKFPIYRGEHPTFVGAVSLEITKRVRVEEALRESKHRLEETLAELKATQQQVLQQERLAAVGQLAAGIAHDFNNLLTSVIGSAELLQLNPDIAESAREDLARIVQQGQRGAHLVRQILDFARKTIRQPQSLDLVPLVKEATRFLARTVSENIHILLEVEADKLLIKGDPTQLQQMLTNLAVNARDAMPTGGTLRICLSRLILMPDQELPYPELTPGAWGVLSVSDTGVGIPAERLPHIFEPFFTTKGPGKRTGLGLAQVHGIVKQHEGHIDVTSQTRGGTTFTIYLPLRTTESFSSQKAPKELPRGVGQTILLVEDEREVLAINQTLLEHLGYRVLAATNSRQALALYTAHRNEIALVLTDMVMPEMNGLALMHFLKKHDPEVKVLMMTGYPSQSEEAKEMLAHGIIDWLQKPLTLTQLAQVVSRALQ